MTTKIPRVTLIGLNYVPERTGIAPYTSGLASSLRQLGWKVRAITAFPHYPSWIVPAGYKGRIMRETIMGVRVTRLRTYLPARPSGVKRLFVETSFGTLSAFARWGSADVVVLVSPALFAVAVAQLRARIGWGRPKVIVWVQDLYSLGVAETGQLGGRGARLMTLVESYVLRKADKVVVIHERFANYVVKTLRVPSDKVHVVRNWTHIQATTVDKSLYREKFGWGDEVVVLHAGNMGAKQALDNVVNAARLADESNANIRFVLLGDGNQKSQLLELAKGVCRLTFMEPLDDNDFYGALAAADLLLVNEKPGVTEMAVPSKLTSYFAASRPVIVASDDGSISSEEVASARAGVRVDAGNPAALLAQALELGQDDERCDLYGRNGRSYQAGTLSRDTSVAHYAEIINGLLSEHGA